jgi:COP9 signalosome complex subunit 6
MLLLQPSFQGGSQSLPFRAFEPTMEIRDRRSLTFFINVPYTVETGEAERIAVDFTGKGGEQGSTRWFTF